MSCHANHLQYEYDLLDRFVDIEAENVAQIPCSKGFTKKVAYQIPLGSGNTIPQFLGWNFREWGNSN